MGGSWSWFAARKLVALAATIVLAPTVVWTVFSALNGTGGQSLPSVAADYVVQTSWHFDPGPSSAHSEDMVAAVMLASLPADLGLVVGSVIVGITPGMAGGLVVARGPGTGRARAIEQPFVSALMDYEELSDQPPGWLKAMWIPIGLPLAAAVMRMTAATLRETAGEELLRTARAKGPRDPLRVRVRRLPMIQAMVIETTVLIAVANTLAEPRAGPSGSARAVTQ